MTPSEMDIHLTEHDSFRNLLAFVILMGNEKAITKSPDYIMEKFARYCGDPSTKALNNVETWPWGLDSSNRATFAAYMRQWGDPEKKAQWEMIPRTGESPDANN